MVKQTLPRSLARWAITASRADFPIPRHPARSEDIRKHLGDILQLIQLHTVANTSRGRAVVDKLNKELKGTLMSSSNLVPEAGKVNGRWLPKASSIPEAQAYLKSQFRSLLRNP